jgi:hypothetical protein
MATLQKQQIDPAQPQTPMPPPAPPRAATMQQQQALSGVPTPPSTPSNTNQMTTQLNTAMQMSKPLTASPTLNESPTTGGSTPTQGTPPPIPSAPPPSASVNPQTAALTVAPPQVAPVSPSGYGVGGSTTLPPASSTASPSVSQYQQMVANGGAGTSREAVASQLLGLGGWALGSTPIEVLQWLKANDPDWTPGTWEDAQRLAGNDVQGQGGYATIQDGEITSAGGNTSNMTSTLGQELGVDDDAVAQMLAQLSGAMGNGYGVGGSTTLPPAKPFIDSPSIDPSGGVTGPPSTGTGSGVPGGGSIDPTTGVPPINPGSNAATGELDPDLLYDSEAEMDDYLSQGNQVITDQMDKRRADQMRMLKERAVARGLGTGDSPIDFETDELTSQLSREEREARFDLLDRSQGLDIQRDQMAQQSKFFAAQFGMDERKLAEDTRRFGLSHALQQQGMDRDEAFRYAAMAQEKGLTSRGLDISEMQAKGQLNQQQLQFMMSLMNVMDPEDLKKLGLDKVFADALLGSGGLGGGSNGGTGGGVGTPETRQQQRESIKTQIADIDAQLASGGLSGRERIDLMAKKQQLQNNLNQLGDE